MKLEKNKYCTYVPLIRIIVIKLSHCSNIRLTLTLNQNGSDFTFLIHVLRRCWFTLCTALPWIALCHSWLMLHLGKLEGVTSHFPGSYHRAGRWMTTLYFISTEEKIDDITTQVWWATLPKQRARGHSKRQNCVHIHYNVYKLNGVISAVVSLFQTVRQHQLMWFLTFLSDAITLNIFSEECFHPIISRGWIFMSLSHVRMWALLLPRV